MLKYHMPTRLYFGRDCLLENAADIFGLGKNALIVTDKNSARLSGAGEDLLRTLKRNNISFEIFDEVTENPTLGAVCRGARLLKEKRADFLIGVGGGSPIDAAKAISVIAANNFEGREIYSSGKIKKAYPIVAVPTTAGTGTEATPYSVITDEEISRKAGFGSPHIYPVVSYLDPKYTLSLNANQTRNTAIDALSHLLEGIYSTDRNFLVTPLIHKGASIIYSNLVPALTDLKNFEYRERLMRAALYGGMVIAQTSTTLQHAIGNPLTTEFGIPHGLANGIVMKEIMELFYSSVRNQIDDLFLCLGVSKREFYDWLDLLDMKLTDKLTDDFIERSSKSVMKSGDIPISPVEVREDTVRKIYKSLR